MSTRWIGGFVAVSLMLWTALASAEEADVEPTGPTTPTETATSDPTEDTQNLDRAREHFQTGLNLVRRENWEAALTEFEESMRLYPTGVAQYNQGLCLKYLHRYQESIEVLEDYLVRWNSEVDPMRRAEVNAMLESL